MADYELYEDLITRAGQLYLVLKKLEAANEYQGERAISINGRTVYISVDGPYFQMSDRPGANINFGIDTSQGA